MSENVEPSFWGTVIRLEPKDKTTVLSQLVIQVSALKHYDPAPWGPSRSTGPVMNMFVRIMIEQL